MQGRGRRSNIWGISLQVLTIMLMPGYYPQFWGGHYRQGGHTVGHASGSVVSLSPHPQLGPVKADQLNTASMPVINLKSTFTKGQATALPYSSKLKAKSKLIPNRLNTSPNLCHNAG